MQSFFATFFIGLLQDLLTTQPIKIVITALIPSFAMKDQLHGIVDILKESFIEHVKDTAEQGGNLVKGRVVDKSHSIQVVQHFSPSCRAARGHAAYNIPAARVLRNISDEDLLNCQTCDTSQNDSPIAIFFVAIVGIFSLMGDFQGDQMFDIALSTVITGFVLLNEFLWGISVYMFIAFYAILCGWLLYLNSGSLQGCFNGSINDINDESDFDIEEVAETTESGTGTGGSNGLGDEKNI